MSDDTHRNTPAGLWTLFACSAFLFAGFFSGCTSFKKMAMIMGDDPVQDRPAAIARGATIYENNCVACHGDSGRGDGPAVAETEIVPADLQVIAKQKLVNTFAANITYGKGEGMPAYRGQLTAEQIWDVAHFVKAFAQE